MPIAAAGQPTTQEPRVCPRLPSTPEPVPKGADLFDEAGGLTEGSPGGSRGFVHPGGSPPQSPITSPPSSFSSSPFLHPHQMQMGMEPPRTRSRSRSGYYQQYGVGGNGGMLTGGGVTVSSLQHHHHQLHPNQHHHLHPHQNYPNQLHPQQQQLGAGRDASLGIQRLSSVSGVHRIPVAGEKKRSLGRDYHPLCLKCHKCNRQLTAGQHAEYDEKPFCSHCYMKMFGPRGTRSHLSELTLNLYVKAISEFLSLSDSFLTGNR
ncbi:unnamed protein product [Menidia menidia]|uniref:(Atlantic silverside) hypothetical protein n=1 Tax=Menidia menidia TaxID=238744 RepID=A0A8S4B4J2_9TELE|nr:unnamed protein product [Menidia menidia]